MDHSTAIPAPIQRPLSGGLPAAPSPAPLPLPASPPPLPVPDPVSEVSYESISPSEKSVFHRKVRRYQNWTENVTREGGVQVSESSFGRAGGVGSASWGSLPTIKALSRDGTEPSTIVDQRHRARQALKHPLTNAPLRPIHYAPLVFPPGSVKQNSLPEMVPPPVVASRIVDTPAPMTSVDLLSPAGSIPLNRGPPVPQKPISRQASHDNVRRPSPSPQIQVSRQASRSEMRRPSPTPFLAKPQSSASKTDQQASAPSSRPLSPPSHHQQNLAIPAAVGSDRRSSGHSGHSTQSAYREREAYISSALQLPLEMLSEKQSAPTAPARRSSIKRWTSLLRRKSRQSDVAPIAPQPQVLSGPEASLPSQVGSTLKKRPSDKQKTPSTQLTRSHTIGAGASQGKAKAKEATMSSVSLPAKEKGSLRSQHSTRRPLPHLAPDATLTPAGSGSAIHRDEVEVLSTPPRGHPHSANALQLDPGHHVPPHTSLHQSNTVPALGSASSKRSARPVHTHVPQNTPTQLRDPSISHRPTQSASQVQLPTLAAQLHRQQLQPPRPALSREVSSIDGLTKTLGRRHRDPSLTNLTARFEPEMYSLPDSVPTGDERIESPVKPSSHVHRVATTVPPAPIPAPSGPFHHPLPQSNQAGILADTQSTLAARRARPVEPVQIAPELLHPQPQSAVPPKIPELAPAHDHVSSLPRLHPPARVISPSQRREVQFSPQTQGRRHDDEEEVRFEVPSRSNGRLRVSVAWLRDRQRNGESEMDSNGSPPPLPPKGPASIVDRFKRRNEQHPKTPHSDLQERAEGEMHPGIAYTASASASQARSPPPMGRSFFNPFWSNRLAPYSPPPLAPVYQMQPGMAYPQPGMPYQAWPHPGQPYRQASKSHRPASPPRPPSVDPPSSQGSPVARPSALPHMPGPYPAQPGMPWYPQHGQPDPSHHPAVQGYVSRNQRRERGGPSFWQKLFQNEREDDAGTIDHWRRDVRQAPPPPPTAMRRGPVTAPLYRNVGYPRSQRNAWWKRPPASAWSDDHHTVAQEEYRRRENTQRYESQRRRDGRRPRQGSGGSFWDVFRRRTDEVYMRSPPRRNARLPPPAPSTHPTPVQSPTRQQSSRRDRYNPPGQPRRPGIAQRWSNRKWMNGDTRPAGNGRISKPSRPTQNGFMSHTERQQAKDQRREYKRQRREAREQRRQAYGRDRNTNGGFFSGRTRDEGPSQAPNRSNRDGARRQDGRGRDMGMVGDWAKGISKMFRDPDRNKYYR